MLKFEGTTHLLSPQTWLPAHFTHDDPPAPQLLKSVPGRQAPPGVQQPLQLCEPQAGRQIESEHTFPAAHA